MKYTEEEMKTIEQAKSNLLRGNDIESATLILEKVILDGMIIKCGRINILKVAARQIINFIEEYKNKEYLDVAREKVYANEESRRKDELIEKQQKEIKELTVSNKELDKELDKECSRLERKEVKMQKEIDRLKGQNVVINYMRSGKNLLSRIATDYAESTLREFELQSVSGYTIDFIIDLFKRGFVLVDEEDYISKEAIREKIKAIEERIEEENEMLECNQICKEDYESRVKYLNYALNIYKRLLGDE